MRRRRFPRGPIRPRPGMRSASGRRPIPPKLIEAHRAFELGEYHKAAELYLELAVKAQERGIPQAPNLYLRGATSLLKEGNAQEALEYLKQGLAILADRKKWIQLKRLAEIAVISLKSEGQAELAAQVQNWVDEQVPEEIKNSEVWRRMPAARAGTLKLPATCGQCGGPVHPNEVEWYDRGNPVCSYCGAVLDKNG